MGQQGVAVATHAGQVPVGGGAALAVVDHPVMDLQTGSGATTGPHARVPVTFHDGAAHHLGDVAAVVGDPCDVHPVEEQDLDEGSGEHGPDGFRDRHRP